MATTEKIKYDILSSPEYKRCIGYDQNNPHHYLPLDLHMQMVADICEKEAPWSDRLYLAAMLHDVGKPDPDVATKDSKTGYTRFFGHAEKSAELAKTILMREGFSEKYVNVVCWYVRHHDDFISFKVTPVPDNHPFLRSVTVQNVAEVILKATIRFAPETKESNKNATVRYLITGKAPSWGRVEKCLPGTDGDNGNLFPTLSIYRNLLVLCRADAMAQSKVAYRKDGSVDMTREEKIAIIDRIESVLEEAYQLAYETAEKLNQ